MKIQMPTLALAALVLTMAPNLAAASAGQLVGNSGDTAGAVQAPRGWVAKRADNICGLKDAKKLSTPASIDLNKVLRATTEFKEIQRKGLKKGDAEYHLLYNQALTRLTNAAGKAQQANGHCSIWKKVSHSDGRAVTDLTAAVMANL